MRFKGFVLSIWCILALPKALQVLCHLFRKWQVFCVKLFDLIDRSPSVLCKVEDVHFAVAVDDPLTNLRMTQGLQHMSLASEGIMPKLIFNLPCANPMAFETLPPRRAMGR